MTTKERLDKFICAQMRSMLDGGEFGNSHCEVRRAGNSVVASISYEVRKGPTTVHKHTTTRLDGDEDAAINELLDIHDFVIGRIN